MGRGGVCLVCNILICINMLMLGFGLQSWKMRVLAICYQKEAHDGIFT